MTMTTQQNHDQHDRFAEFVSAYSADNYLGATNETRIPLDTLRSIAKTMNARYREAALWEVYRDEGLRLRFQDGPSEDLKSAFLLESEPRIYVDKGASGEARMFGMLFGLAWWTLRRRDEVFTEADAVNLAAALLGGDASVEREGRSREAEESSDSRMKFAASSDHVICLTQTGIAFTNGDAELLAAELALQRCPSEAAMTFTPHQSEAAEWRST